MVRGIPFGIRLAAWIFAIAAMVYTLAPLIVVIGVSVSPSEFLIFPPTGFSLRWFRNVFNTNAYVDAFFLSVKLGISVTLFATIVGGGCAIALHRRRLPGSTFLAALFLSPLILPTIIFAVGLLMLWSTVFGPVSFWALFFAHLVVTLPYVVRTTLAVLADSDQYLEEAAKTMGARRWQRIWHVVLPQCTPGLAAGGFFAFNISFDEVVVALFLRTSSNTTLPIQIYNQLEFNADPTVAAVSTLMIGITVVTIALMDRLLGIQRFT